MTELHPLVLLNISDHYLRQIQHFTGKHVPFCGVLLGERISNENENTNANTSDTGNKVDTGSEKQTQAQEQVKDQGKGQVNIINSFEIVFTEQGQIDFEYLIKRFQQNKVIYPTEEFLGVYEIVSGDGLELSDHLIELKSVLSKLKFDEDGIISEEVLGNGGEGDVKELVSLTFNPKLLKLKHSNKKFLNLYDHENIELKYEIKTKESEKVAIETVLELKESLNYSEHDKTKDQISDQEFVLKTLRNKLKLIAITLNDIPTLTSQAADTSVDFAEERKRQLRSIDPNVFQRLRDINSFLSKVNYKQSTKVQKDLIDLETDLNISLNVGVLAGNITGLERVNTDIRKVENLREYYQ